METSRLVRVGFERSAPAERVQDTEATETGKRVLTLMISLWSLFLYSSVQGD